VNSTNSAVNACLRRGTCWFLVIVWTSLVAVTMH
jgi:hypothetical protein